MGLADGWGGWGDLGGVERPQCRAEQVGAGVVVDQAQAAAGQVVDPGAGQLHVEVDGVVVHDATLGGQGAQQHQPAAGLGGAGPGGAEPAGQVGGQLVVHAGPDD